MIVISKLSKPNLYRHCFPVLPKMLYYYSIRAEITLHFLTFYYSFKYFNILSSSGVHNFLYGIIKINMKYERLYLKVLDVNY